MTDDVKSQRRRFLMGAGALLGGGAFAGAALGQAAKKPEAKGAGDAKGATGKDAKGAGDLPLVDEKSSLATTLKYVHDAAKAPAGVMVAKGGVPGDKQFCDNCLFYAKAGTNGGKEAGKCQLFAQGNVMAKGWCSSWTKKP